MNLSTTERAKISKTLAAVAFTAILVTLATQGLAAEKPTLRERLEKGLMARTKSDFAFLDLVVKRVDQKKLPQKLVDRVFFWSREKARKQKDTKSRRPMVYFRPALIELAKRIKVDLT